MRPKIIELIPGDLPDWATQAIHGGQFFRVALNLIVDLTETIRLLENDLAEIRAERRISTDD